MPLQLDIAANRRRSNYSLRETYQRLLWAIVWPLFRFSPRPCFGWRRFLLRSLGARIGAQVHVYPSTRVYFPWNLTVGDWSAIGEDALVYNLGQVTLEEKVTISHRAHLCAGTHDYTKADLPLVKLEITVKSQAWICADAFVGPGVIVGQGAVVGARAVVVKSVNAWTVVVGNPAREVKTRHLRN